MDSLSDDFSPDLAVLDGVFLPLEKFAYQVNATAVPGRKASSGIQLGNAPTAAEGEIHTRRQLRVRPPHEMCDELRVIGREKQMLFSGFTTLSYNTQFEDVSQYYLEFRASNFEVFAR